MCLYDFGCTWSPNIVNSQINIFVRLVFVDHVFVALSNKQISFILRKSDVRDLVHVIRHRYEINCVLRRLCAADHELVPWTLINK